MPLDFPAPPKESIVSLNEGLGRLPARNKYAYRTEAAGGEQPEVSLPHEVFVLNPEQITAGKGVADAKPVSWRYVLNQPTGGALMENSATATAEVVYRDGAHIFSNLQHGWLANATRRAIDVAAKLPAVQAGSFDLRVLRIPAERVDSLWLKNNTTNADIVVPIRSAIDVVTAFQPYSADEFLSKIREHLAMKEPFDDRPKNFQG